MADLIKLKRSAIASKIPLTTDLELGELAINTNDGKIYLKKDDGAEAIVEISNADHTHLETDITGLDKYTQAEVDTLLEGKQTQENGFENRTDSILSFLDGTRTFSIDPTGTDYTFYANAVKYVRAGDTKTITDTEGLHYFYYDLSGVIQTTQTFTEEMITDYAFIGFVYWDATNQTAITIGDERHGASMDSATHLYHHQTEGTVYGGGLLPVDISAGENGNSAEDAQIGASSGTIWDEDIKISIDAQSFPANIPILHRTGANGDWRKIAATDYIVTTTGSGRAAYNEWTGATWQLTEVTNNDFLLMHLYATNDINDGYVFIVGQEEYSSVSLARAGATTEILTIDTNGIPVVEYKSIATFIIQTSNTKSNAVKSSVELTDAGDEYVDWRFVNVGAAINVQGAISQGISDLNDTTITDLTADEILKYNGTSWVNNTLAEAGVATSAQGALADTALQSLSLETIDDLSDVSVPAPTDGQSLTWNNTGGYWEATSVSGSSASIVSLTDTTITGAAKGDLLVHNGSEWIDVSAGTNDQVLTADSTEASGVKWADSAGGGGGEDTNSSDFTINQTDTAGKVVQTTSDGTLDVVSGDGLTYINPTTNNHPNTSYNQNYPHLYRTIPGGNDKFLSLSMHSSVLKVTVGTLNPTTNEVTWSTLTAIPNYEGVTDYTYINQPLSLAVDPNADANGDYAFIVMYENATGNTPILRPGIIDGSDDSITFAAASTAVTTGAASQSREQYSVDFCADDTTKHIFAVACRGTSNYPSLWTGKITDATTTISELNSIGAIYSGVLAPNTAEIDIKFCPNNATDNGWAITGLSYNLVRGISIHLNDMASDLTDVSFSSGVIPIWEPAQLCRVYWDKDASGDVYWLTSSDPSDNAPVNSEFDEINIIPGYMNLAASGGTNPLASENNRLFLGNHGNSNPNYNYGAIYGLEFYDDNKAIVGYKFDAGAVSGVEQGKPMYKHIEFSGNYNSKSYEVSLPLSVSGDLPASQRTLAVTSKGIACPGQTYSKYYMINLPDVFSNLDVTSQYGLLAENSTATQESSCQFGGIYTTTGLTTNAVYYPQLNGTIGTDDGGGSVNRIGIALSPTQLLLKGQSGE